MCSRDLTAQLQRRYTTSHLITASTAAVYTASHVSQFRMLTYDIVEYNQMHEIISACNLNKHYLYNSHLTTYTGLYMCSLFAKIIPI